MKEGGDWRRRQPHGSTTFAIPDWASLLPELVQGIADRVLSTTGGVDAYMDMRAACPSWRSAIAKPSPLAAVPDLRFRPRHWIMIELKSNNHDDNAAHLFLHVSTGRFRRLRLPVLRDHFIIDATDGLLVLGKREHPHLAAVLNPFTGDVLHFVAPLPELVEDIASVAVTGGSHVKLFLWHDEERRSISSADPTSHVFTEDWGTYVISMVTFQGNVCYVDLNGHVMKIAGSEEHLVIGQVSQDVDVDVDSEGENRVSSYLVESDGQLLLVRHLNQALKVFRVDVKHKCLELVKSLGGHHALFLGDERCLSVDADKLPSVEGDCIYLFNSFEPSGRAMFVYNLRDCTVEIISSEPMVHLHRPFSLVQVLLHYCDYINVC